MANQPNLNKPTADNAAQPTDEQPTQLSPNPDLSHEDNPSADVANLDGEQPALLPRTPSQREGEQASPPLGGTEGGRDSANLTTSPLPPPTDETPTLLSIPRLPTEAEIPRREVSDSPTGDEETVYSATLSTDPPLPEGTPPTLPVLTTAATEPDAESPDDAGSPRIPDDVDVTRRLAPSSSESTLTPPASSRQDPRRSTAEYRINRQARRRQATRPTVVVGPQGQRSAHLQPQSQPSRPPSTPSQPTTAQADSAPMRQPQPIGPELARTHQLPRTSPPKRSWWQWTVRSLATLSVMVLVGLVLALALGIIGYLTTASQLPPAGELKARAAQFKTTEILDREGNLLWEIIDPNGGRRTTVPLAQISESLVQATVATEDRNFYENVGVDFIGIVRALYLNLSEGEIVSGGSTITQQLARLVLLPEESTERTYTRKMREAVLAVEINRRYTKDEILEVYLNQIYYGNLAYGIEAAAQTYFGKPAAELTLPEASLIAGIPQSPAVYDPYTNLVRTKLRQADVLRLMVKAGNISQDEAQAAFDTQLRFLPVNFTLNAPHFVNEVRAELERIVPPEYIYQVGLRVQTTLDPALQAVAEAEVARQVDALAGYNVSNGALVALDVQSGQVLAMVGSRNFADESIAGQVNLATTPRQVGSTMKPHLYLQAFESLDWTASTLLMDVPVEYPDGVGGVYRPRNYDDKFHGPVLLRNALGNSYNIPVVKTLERLGVAEAVAFMERLGVTSLTRPDYGLSLALGSGEISLLEMTGSYQVFANGGQLVPPTTILQITDSTGRVIEPARPQARQAISPQHAYLMTHILADNRARERTFGLNSPLLLSRPAAAKTGTTNDFRDSWTVGYTPDIVTGVWLGNSDNSPMSQISGVTGAGPIWNAFMEQAHAGLPAREFAIPSDIVQIEVCADSGTVPSEVCPQTKPELFYQAQPPLGPEHDIHQRIEIDRNSGLLANEFCRNNVEARYYQVFPADGRAWAISRGIAQPPDEFCPAGVIVAEISSPLEGASVQGVVELRGAAAAAQFERYQIELGLGTDPQAFMLIQEPQPRLVENGLLGTFDSTQLENGPYTVRVVVFNQYNDSREARVRLLVNNALPTPTSTPTAAVIVLPTSTPTLLPTSTPTPPPQIAPQIDFFVSSADNVPSGQLVTLSWSVSGPVTDIQLTGSPNLPPLFGLANSGQIDIGRAESTDFVLTAFNGNQQSQAMVRLNVIAAPTPTFTPLPLDTPTVTATPQPLDTSTPTPQPLDTATPLPVETATSTPLPIDTPVLEPAAETVTPEPTATLSDAVLPESTILIVGLNKLDDYMEIANIGEQAHDLTGWTVRSGVDERACLLSGPIEAGTVVQVWSLASAVGQGGLNCGFQSELWPDDQPAVVILLDNAGVERSRLE